MSTFFEGEKILGASEIASTVAFGAGTTTIHTAPAGRWEKIAIFASITATATLSIRATDGKLIALASGYYVFHMYAGQTLVCTAPNSGDTVTVVGTALGYEAP